MFGDKASAVKGRSSPRNALITVPAGLCKRLQLYSSTGRKQQLYRPEAAL